MIRRSEPTIVFSLLLAANIVAQTPQPPVHNDEASAAEPRGSNSNVKAPHAIYQPDPDYPTKGREGHTGGTVVVRAVVGTDGVPRDLTVFRGLSTGFDEEAIKAVKRWRFEPAAKDGKPVSAPVNVEIRFLLAR